MKVILAILTLGTFPTHNSHATVDGADISPLERTISYTYIFDYNLKQQESEHAFPIFLRQPKLSTSQNNNQQPSSKAVRTIEKKGYSLKRGRRNIPGFMPLINLSDSGEPPKPKTIHNTHKTISSISVLSEQMERLNVTPTPQNSPAPTTKYPMPTEDLMLIEDPMSPTSYVSSATSKEDRL